MNIKFKKPITHLDKKKIKNLETILLIKKVNIIKEKYLKNYLFLVLFNILNSFLNIL